MRKIVIQSILLGLLLILNLSGCALPTTEEISTSVPETAAKPEVSHALSPAQDQPADATARQVAEARIDYVVDKEDLKAITGASDYQYIELEGDVIGGSFWSDTSAMLTIEFRIHLGGGMDLLEDYRTAANPQSRVWLESPMWDTAIYYEIGDWDAEIVALRGEDCYAVCFVPSAYSAWSAPELGAALMELLIASASDW